MRRRENGRWRDLEGWKEAGRGGAGRWDDREPETESQRGEAAGWSNII